MNRTLTIITPAGIAAGLRALSSYERETPPQRVSVHSPDVYTLHPSQWTTDTPRGEGHDAKVIGQ